MENGKKYCEAIAYICKLNPRIVYLNCVNVVLALIEVAARLYLIAKVFNWENSFQLTTIIFYTLGLILVDVLINMIQFFLRREYDKTDDNILRNIIVNTYNISYCEAEKADLYLKNQEKVFDLTYIGGYANIIGGIFNIASGCLLICYFMVVICQLAVTAFAYNNMVVVLGILFILCCIFFLVINRKNGSNIMDEIIKMEQSRNYFVYSLINNYPIHSVFKTYKFNDYIDSEYRKLNKESYDMNIKYINQVNSAQFQLVFVNIICMSAMFFLCAIVIVSDKSAIVSLPFYVSLAIQMGSSNNELTRSITNLKRNQPYILSMIESVKKTRNVKEQKMSDIPEKIETIEFKNVFFKYHNAEDYIFKGISFKIDFRQKHNYVIVGANGSGKTTMIKMILGMLEPERGEVLVNGTNIKKFLHKNYCKLFNVLMQEYALFDGTIQENIVLNRTNTEEQLQIAVTKSGVDSYLDIHDLNTNIKAMSDDVAVLSGGEEQKLAMARMFYSTDGLYILDEPTAAFDPISESTFFTLFESLYGDNNAVVITHRVMNCKNFDYIFVLKNGKLEQQGTHSELKSCGYYKELLENELKSLKVSNL